MATGTSPVSKKLRRSSGATELSRTSSLVKAMNELRAENQLCDVLLLVQGRRFPAHRVVLASASEVFRLMFTTEMMESVSPNVELRDENPEIIELLIEFIYTGRLPVNTFNVQLLLHAANQYQMEPVKTICTEFLKKMVDESNCLGIAALADFLVCSDLKRYAESFILRHFAEVSMSQEFFQMDVARLKCLLRHDELRISTENQVYESALRWLRHDLPCRQQFVAELLGCIRIPLISKTYLTQVLDEPLIKNSPECLKLLKSAMQYHLLTQTDQKELLEMCRPRLPGQTIAVFEDSPPHRSCYFNPKDHKWTNIRRSVRKHPGGVAVHWNNVVYILGGSKRPNMDCYNVRADRWCSRVGTETPRESLAACASKGKIYVSGGFLKSHLGGPALDLFESYDTQTDTWEAHPRLQLARFHHGMVEVKGIIYVCGGVPGNATSEQVTNRCELYDPRTHQWREFCPMRQARMGHGLVAVQDRIYAIGGSGSQGFLDSVEYYDIISDEWHSAASMPWPLSVKCEAVGEVIYVLSGKGRGTNRLRHVLEYHIETDRWTVCYKARPFTGISCAVCAVDV